MSMTEEQQLKIVEALTRGGVQIGNLVMDNHGTMTLNNHCGGRNEQPREQPRKAATAPIATAPKPLSDARQQLLRQIMDLIALGDWQLSVGAERIGEMMCRVLGADGRQLSPEELQMSEQLWTLFEHRRGGEGLRVTFQNMIGYWDEKRFFHQHSGSPSLCKMFFKTDDGYCNIDKGRPGKAGMLKDFEGVLPLLDQYCPAP